MTDDQLQLYPHQLKMIELASCSKQIVANWGRRTGKSTVLLSMAAESMMNEMSPIIVTHNMRAIDTLRHKSVFGKVYMRTSRFCTTKPCFIERVVKFRPDILYLDEPELYKTDMLDAINDYVTIARPLVRVYGTGISLSTLKALGLGPEVTIYRCPTTVMPNTTDKLLGRLRSGCVSEEQFETEFLAKLWE